MGLDGFHSKSLKGVVSTWEENSSTQGLELFLAYFVFLWALLKLNENIN